MSVHELPDIAAVAGDEGAPTDRSPDDFRPFVPDEARLPELTWSALIVGTLLGIVFGASSLYLVLKVGMTVSASIPVAVISIAIFRALGRSSGKILENNIAQTAGSAGESIAFGVGVTMPALLILGENLDAVRVMMVASIGGLLGILMMIPLRRAFIVKQHKTLKYPEGTACAKVLIVGEQGGSSAKTVFAGFGLAFVYHALMQGLRLWQEVPSRLISGISGYKQAVLASEASPVLVGVGYIIGPRIASTMVAGGILSYLVLVPSIALFGENNAGVLFPGEKPIAAMSAKDVRDAYILYIGAGAVAAGGVISLIQALPLIVGSITAGLRDMRSTAKGGERPTGKRTARDLPLWLVILGSAALVATIAASPLIPTALPGRIVGAGAVVLFGFLFVTVSSRLTGEIGSSSNPISGMTVATLLFTCLAFVALGWVGRDYRLAALSIAGIVCIAASNGGTTSQDLKTGFLVGGTPYKQQIAILAGGLASAFVMGGTLLLLNDAGTVITDKVELPTVRPAESELRGTQVFRGTTYRVWWNTDARPGAPAGKYLVDDEGDVRFLVDPAINGKVDRRDDGTRATKYDAPKTRLMSLIIDGIMTNRLPWGLVLLGVMIAVLMELAGVPALAFAVGVYLPLGTSMAVFLGGATRWMVDRVKKSKAEESDSSPAVLLSSGYIAGGAIAGILVAFLEIAGIAGFLDLSRFLPDSWNKSPLPALLTLAPMIFLLFLVGVRAKGRPAGGGTEPKFAGPLSEEAAP